MAQSKWLRKLFQTHGENGQILKVTLLHCRVTKTYFEQPGPGLHPLLRAPHAAGARNICVGFADVTRIWRQSGVNHGVKSIRFK
jgi:hypothetical protein